MKIFGDKQEFAIEYKLTPSPYNEEELLEKSWGILKLWIMNHDICEYRSDGATRQYEWNLIYIVEWLCNNLEHIFGYDPFPLPVQGENLLDLIRKSNNFESEEDDEFYLWYQAKNSWIFRHSWFSNRAGSILANVYFRRIEDNIEIGWNNDFYEEKQVFFTNSTGTYYLERVAFKKVIFGSLTDILRDLEFSLGRDAKIGSQSITDLRKRISVLE